jgi:hypothetical protein
MANIIVMLASTLQAILTLIAFALYFVGLSFLEPSSSFQAFSSTVSLRRKPRHKLLAPWLRARFFFSLRGRDSNRFSCAKRE